MPDIYEVEIGGEIYEVEASDPQTAYQIGEQYAKSPQIRPHKPGVVERGLSALSESGPVPAMVAGAARDILAPVSRGVQALKSSLPRASATEGGVPGAREILDFYFGDKSRISGEYANPDEELGAGLAQGIGILSLPSAAPAVASAVGRGSRAAGKVLDSRFGSMILPSTRNEPGIMAGLGRVRGEIANWLKGPNAGGRLVRETVDDAAKSAVDDLLREGGQYGEVPLAHPTGGGYTVPSTLPSAPGGRLAPRTPSQTMQDDLISALEELRVPQTPPRTPEAVRVPPTSPAGGGYTVPPEVPPAAPSPVPRRPPPTPPPTPAAAQPPSSPQQRMNEELAKRMTPTTPLKQEAATTAEGVRPSKSKGFKFSPGDNRRMMDTFGTADADAIIADIGYGPFETWLEAGRNKSWAGKYSAAVKAKQAREAGKK